MAKTQKELWADKINFMKSFQGGVIFCAYTQAQAQICEKIGAKAIIALEPPAPPGTEEGELLYGNIDPVRSIMDTVVLPVFGQIRIGHKVEAYVMQEIGVDGIHEFYNLFDAETAGSAAAPPNAGAAAGVVPPILGPVGVVAPPVVKGKAPGAAAAAAAAAAAEPEIPEIIFQKQPFRVPFLCAVSNLDEAIQRTAEGASMLHTRGGFDGTPGAASSLSVAVTELSTIAREIKELVGARAKGKTKDLEDYAKSIKVPVGFVDQVAKLGKLPIPLFGYGGVRTPTDAAFLKSSHCDGIIVDPAVLNSLDAQRRAYGIVLATMNPTNYKMIAGISSKLGVHQ